MACPSLNGTREGCVQASSGGSGSTGSPFSGDAFPTLLQARNLSPDGPPRRLLVDVDVACESIGPAPMAQAQTSESEAQQTRGRGFRNQAQR